MSIRRQLQPLWSFLGTIAIACGFELFIALDPVIAQVAGAEAKSLQEQDQLFKGAEQLRRQRKFPESITAIGKALAIEKNLNGEATHLTLFLQDYLAGVQQQAKDHEAARKTLALAGALQRQFLQVPGKAADPKAKKLQDRWGELIALRRQALGKEHPWVGLSLIDLALAQEKEGHRDLAEASLQEAIQVFTVSRFESVSAPLSGIMTLTDAYYHLDRLQASARPAVSKEFTEALQLALKRCAQAEQSEKQGQIALAAKLWRETLSNVSGRQFGAHSLAAQLEMSKQARPVLDRYLSFCGRMADKKAVWAPGGTSFDKGAIFVHQRRIWLERQHPALRPFFEVHDAVSRRLASLAGSVSGDEKLKVASLLKNALEAELGRRHAKLPRFQNQPVQGQLPPGSVLVDYQVYTYVPLAGEAAPKEEAVRRLGCFIYRARQAEVIYLDLGPLTPIAQAIQQWRQDIQKRQGGFGRGFVLDPAAVDNGIKFPQVILRKKLWEPLQSYLDKAELVLIAADDVLASVPFGALPGSKPGSYLLQEIPIVLSPVPMLITPLKSQTEFLAKRDAPAWSSGPRPEPLEGPLLIGGVDFGLAAGTGRRFAPLPATKREIAKIGALFEKLNPGKKAVSLTEREASKTAFSQQAPRHRWLHLATHGYFAANASVAGLSQPELRSALVLAGAGSSEPTEAAEGLLTALEVAALDLTATDLAVLSACETGLGESMAGEGVLGLQRALLLAGAKTTVTSLWQVDDDATEALMVEFYRNLWQRNLPKLEALRQAQIGLLQGKLYRPRGLDEKEDVPPYFWAAFAMSGDWRK